MFTAHPRNRIHESGSGLAPAVIDRNRALLQEAETHVYKTVGEQPLDVHIFNPGGHSSSPRAAIIFFFSSQWDSGLISQFAPHCMYFAHRGMVAMLFDYRVSSRHRSNPTHSMSDARSAMRWVRMNAADLDIDPEKIVAAGGAGGAQIAAATAMLEGFDDPGDDLDISCKPNALLLFNPILDTTRKGAELDRFPDKKTAKEASLIHHCARKLPPMLLFHGTADRVVPYEISKKFTRKLKWRGNDCRLQTFEGCGHGFFNFNVDAGLYERTLNAADSFLVEKELLAPLEDPDA